MPLFARSDTVSLDPSEIKEIVSEWRIGQEFQVAIVALLVYDAIITFDKEVKFFWTTQKIPRRPIDFVYFMNRYIGILGASAYLYLGSFNATLPLCNFSIWAQTIANWVIIISIDYILMIRVLALYSQDKTLSICLKTLLALEAAFELGLVIYLNIFEHLVLGVFANISVCATSTIPAWRLAMVDWLVPLTYGTLLMILALYKAAEYWRMSAGFKGFTLVKVLIEDQIVYFVLTISFSVFSILGFKLAIANSFLYAVLNELGNPAILSLLGSRMLFNLKEAGERGQNEGTSYRTPSRTMSSLDFAEPVNPQMESEATHSGSEQASEIDFSEPVSPQRESRTTHRGSEQVE